MNIDTGKLEYLEMELSAEEARNRRLVEIKGELLTELQKKQGYVLPDESDAGRVLQAARNMDRSKYQPHIGEKQRAKMERRQAVNS